MKRIFFLSLSILLFAGCKKSDTSASCTLSATALVGTYKQVGYTSQQTASSPVVDDYATTWTACEKDDIVVLSANGMYQRIDAGVTCSPPNTTINGSWNLNGNILTTDGTATTVITFDCTNLVVVTNSYPKITGTYIKQ